MQINNETVMKMENTFITISAADEGGGMEIYMKENKVLRYSMQLALLNQLRDRKLISEREYILIKSSLMRDYKIVSDLTT